jgi:hypothetical protein
VSEVDLKSFVAESLSQILEGIRDAQGRPHGENVAADGYIGAHGNLLTGGTSGFFTVVDFDVSVIAESKEGAGTVRVAEIEASDANIRSGQNTSRVKFSVHVRLPKGGGVLISTQDNQYVAPENYVD